MAKERDIDPVFGDGGDFGANPELAKIGLPVDDPSAGRADSGGAGIGGTTADAGTGSRGRRGRKPGSVNASKKAPSNLGLETLLLNIHNMLGMALQTPELALDKEEAKMLADSVAAVNSYYNTVVDAKTMAWINLTGTVAAIYGPRIFVLRERFKRKGSKPEQRTEAPMQADVSPVVPFNGPTLVNEAG